MCRDICLKNSLGENCLHTCGCVLGRNIIYLLLKNGQLFRSVDMGKIWDDERESLHEYFERSTKLNKHLNSYKTNEDFLSLKDMIPNPENPNILWFLGKTTINWRTEDAGGSYNIWFIESLKVSSIFLHPIRNTSLLATTMMPEACDGWSSDILLECKQKLHVTHDGGISWDLLEENVKKFGWGNSGKILNKIETRYHQHYVFGTMRKKTAVQGEEFNTVDWTTVYFTKTNEKNEKKLEVMFICNKWWLKDGKGFKKCDKILDNLHSFYFFTNYIYLAFYTLDNEVNPIHKKD